MNHQKGAVLVVEDHDLERHTLQTLLRLEGYHVYTAADGGEALQYIDHDVDVVLSDLRMYGKGGVELLRLWKARRPSTPFIFVTGVYEIAQVVEAVKLGAEDYLTKPYNSAVLLERVADCVEAARERSPYDEGLSDSSPLEEPEDDGSLALPAGATMDEIERTAIEHALRRHRGNRTRAAEALRISVRTLQRKLRAWATAAS